jgi:hypothetical protein
MSRQHQLREGNSRSGSRIKLEAGIWSFVDMLLQPAAFLSAVEGECISN